MRTIGVLLIEIMLGFVVPAVTIAQVFFNTEKNSGSIVEMAPGIAYYQDRTKSGVITEMAPGITYFNLTGQNGQPGETGIAVDLTPRYTPTPDPMVDTLMPPLPKGTTAHDLPPPTFSWEK
jgi:hypothetical protein